MNDVRPVDIVHIAILIVILILVALRLAFNIMDRRNK